MLNYIQEYCELPPLNRPEYDDDTGTWDLYFAEKQEYCPYNLEQELICLPFDTLEEAQETLKQVLKLYYEQKEPTKEYEKQQES